MACSESDAAPEGRSADDRTAALIRAATTGRDLPEPSGKPCAGISGVLVGTRAKCVWNDARQNLVESGADAACSSGVPVRKPPCYAGRRFSPTANVAVAKICIMTKSAHILRYIVRCPGFVHCSVTTAAAIRRFTKSEAVD